MGSVRLLPSFMSSTNFSCEVKSFISELKQAETDSQEERSCSLTLEPLLESRDILNFFSFFCNKCLNKTLRSIPETTGRSSVTVREIGPCSGLQRHPGPHHFLRLSPSSPERESLSFFTFVFSSLRKTYVAE